MSDVSQGAAASSAADGSAPAARVRPPRERPMIAVSGVAATAPSVMTLPSGETGVGFSMYAGRETPALMVVSFPNDASGEQARKFAGDFGKAAATVEGARRRETAEGLGVDVTIAGRWRKGVPLEDGKSSYWFQGVEAGIGKDLTMPAVEASAKADAAKLAEREAAKAEKAAAPVVAKGNVREAPVVAPDGPLSDADKARFSDVAAIEKAVRAGKNPSVKDPEAFLLVVSADQARGAGDDALARVGALAVQARDPGRDVRLHGGFRSVAVPYAAVAAKLAEAGPEAAAGFVRELPAAAKISAGNGAKAHAMYRANKAKTAAGAEV